jgi:hypothetical protein
MFIGRENASQVCINEIYGCKTFLDVVIVECQSSSEMVSVMYLTHFYGEKRGRRLEGDEVWHEHFRMVKGVWNGRKLVSYPNKLPKEDGVAFCGLGRIIVLSLMCGL